MSSSLLPLSIQIKKIHPKAIIPVYAYDGDSGMDLYACIDEPITIENGQIKLIPCGFSIAIPEGYEGQIRSKSGLAYNQGLVILNSPGTVDSCYRGEICVILYLTPSLEWGQYTVQPDQKIAQLVICPVEKCQWQLVNELDVTIRNEGGFGSSGI